MFNLISSLVSNKNGPKYFTTIIKKKVPEIQHQDSREKLSFGNDVLFLYFVLKVAKLLVNLNCMYNHP